MNSLSSRSKFQYSILTTIGFGPLTALSSAAVPPRIRTFVVSDSGQNRCSQEIGANPFGPQSDFFWYIPRGHVSTLERENLGDSITHEIDCMEIRLKDERGKICVYLPKWFLKAFSHFQGDEIIQRGKPIAEPLVERISQIERGKIGQRCKRIAKRLIEIVSKGERSEMGE